MSAVAILSSFGAAFCWAVAPLIYRRNLGGLSLYELNAVRSIGFTGGMVVLALIFNPDILFHIPSATVIAASAAITLIANLLGDLFFMASIEAMGVSFAVAVTSTFPLITIATSAIWLKEPLSLALIVGAVTIVLGLNFIRMGYSERDIGPSLRKGFILALTTAIFWGLSDTMIRWTILETGVDSLTFALWRSLAFLPLAWGAWIFKSFKKPAGKSLFKKIGVRQGVELVFVGMLALAVAGTFVNIALENAPASLVVPLTATSPLLSTLLAVLIFREGVTRGQWLGVFLIVIGSALVCR